MAKGGLIRREIKAVVDGTVHLGYEIATGIDVFLLAVGLGIVMLAVHYILEFGVEDLLNFVQDDILAIINDIIGIVSSGVSAVESAFGGGGGGISKIYLAQLVPFFQVLMNLDSICKPYSGFSSMAAYLSRRVAHVTANTYICGIPRFFSQSVFLRIITYLIFYFLVWDAEPLPSGGNCGLPEGIDVCFIYYFGWWWFTSMIWLLFPIRWVLVSYFSLIRLNWKLVKSLMDSTESVVHFIGRVVHRPKKWRKAWARFKEDMKTYLGWLE